MAVNPDTVRDKNVRITPTPKDKGVQVVITIKKMDNGGIYINCGGPDERPLRGPGDSQTPELAVNGIASVVSIAVEELLKASAKRPPRTPG
jgi:hypothetical protein